MVVYFDPEKGIVDDQASITEQKPPMGLDPIGRVAWERDQQGRQAIDQFEAQASDKPVWAKDPGQALDEVGNIIGNAASGLVTDYMDLGAGLADIAVQGVQAFQGKGFDTGKIFDDSDNPWTQWRQDNFEAETQVGEVASGLVRVGTMIATLPKIGIKGLAIAPRLLKASKLPVAAEFGADIAKGLDRFDDFLKGPREGSKAIVGALDEVGKGFAPGSAAARATKIAKQDDWLAMTFKDVANAPEAKNWWRGVEDSARALTQLKGSKSKIRTFAEALGWDAFIAFNVYGEGDNSFDETLGDALADMGVTTPLPRTGIEDTGLDRKIKQMTEGLVTGAVISGLLDMHRVYRFSKAFNAAEPAERVAIRNAFQKEADQLGRGLAGMSDIGVVPDQQFSPFVDPWMRPSTTVTRGISKEGARGVEDFADPNVTGNFADQVSGFQPGGVWNPAEIDPWNRGGALATLRSQVDTERIAQQYQRDMSAAYLQNNANNPVQNRLAQMEGAASPLPQLDEDPLYQQWLANKAPAESFMPPQTGENPALQQFTGQGAMPSPASQGGPDDLEAYRAWLEQNAKGPDGQLNPEVQQALRRLEGIGELAPRQQAGMAGAEQFPGAAAVEPVQVTDLGPRPPEPIVTPQTIRNAFQADFARVLRESQRLTFVEGPDGVMRSLDELRNGVKQLMPRTRVDAMEYITKNPPAANEFGVIPASDSVWTNFITNRGLSEGWASIDPETMEVRFNRKAALDLDRGDLAAKQAQALDELDENNRYQEWLQQQEPMNPGSMRPEVQDRLAQMEANTAYDNWEAGQAAVKQGEQDVPGATGLDQGGAKQADPAAADLKRQAVTAGIEADQFDNAEELRLSQAELAKLTGQLSDQDVVREYLGTTLDSVQRPEVVKAEVGRGWEVYGADGEALGSTTTKKAADKLADAEVKRSQDALLARARQMEADAADTPVGMQVGTQPVDSSVMGRTQMTAAQTAALQRRKAELQALLPESWVNRQGTFFDALDQAKAGGKNTFDLSQGEMNDLGVGVRRLLESGQLKGAELRTWRAIADRLDTGVKLLGPQARQQQLVEQTLADAKRFLEHGDIC